MTASKHESKIKVYNGEVFIIYGKSKSASHNSVSIVVKALQDLPELSTLYPNNSNLEIIYMEDIMGFLTQHSFIEADFKPPADLDATRPIYVDILKGTIR